ncbi:hypothetical protein NK718_19060 [Alsobacter sp. SYSU M60028]|uniref:Uncharacterized protein n=1 Tax=Alsobacter ponti TaxID=2962936 RepID=A0ABT1LGK8_9HYPH|nr:hypothetical protein [Alsobacter ponti]MCP8940630.1 hypothetical protein [Alsobacter ponti]
MQTPETPSSPTPATVDAPAAEAPREAQAAPVSDAKPAEAVAPAAASAPEKRAEAPSLSAGERPAPQPAVPAGGKPWLPPGVAAALRSGASRLKVEARAHGAVLAVAAVLFGAGVALGMATAGGGAPVQVARHDARQEAAAGVQAMLQWKGAMAIGPGPAQPENPRLAADLKALRANVDALRASLDDLRGLDKRVAALGQGLERVRAEAAQNATLLNGQFDKARNETTAALGQISATVKGIDQASREPAAKLAQIAEKLDRLEKGGPLTTASIQPAGPSQPPQAAAEPSPPRGRPLAGWGVHQVRNGVAIVEGPDGVYEIMQGQTVPGLGRIEGFERKGKGWQVVTARGVIEPVAR